MKVAEQGKLYRQCRIPKCFNIIILKATMQCAYFQYG